MNNIAVFVGTTSIYWSSIIIALGVAACFALTFALYTSHGGRASAVWVLLPFAVILSVLLSRMLHWYCHAEQYAGFWAAVTVYSIGDYCFPGVIVGTLLAALLVKLLGFTKNLAKLFDCLAPGAALLVAFIRLSSLFNYSCRSKIAVNNPLLQRLPIAATIPTSSGALEYRFATFFVQFLLMLVVFLMLMRFFFKRRKIAMKNGYPKDGNVAMMFMILFGTVEMVLDSTRYDSSFLPFNNFISIVQIVGAVCVLTALIFYSVRSVKSNGLRPYHWCIWGAYVLCLAAIGVSEYLVQRYGSWYLYCYSAMSVCGIIIAILVYRLYITVCRKKTVKV